MEPLDLSRELATLSAIDEDIVVSFIPACDSGQLWAWELCQGTKEQPVDGDSQAIANGGDGERDQEKRYV
jgi:hypothetical protein